MKFNLIITALALSLLFSCTKKPQVNKTVVKGSITVSDSIDNSGDFSGIGITILNQDSAENTIDTLITLSTDTTGFFEGEVQFPQKDYYRLIISRNNNDIGYISVILADGDTLQLKGELPEIHKNITLKSREHDALATYNRVERNFQRVAAFIQSGSIPDSTIAEEIYKWSNLYWEVYEENENTLASYMAAEKSAGLLSGFDNEGMLQRLNQALPADYIIPVAVELGKPYIAKAKGFKAASMYLDSLVAITNNEALKELILRDKIKMYFDSSRVKDARFLLGEYEQEYAEKSNSQQWAKKIRYDINYLAPGVTAPDFNFVTMEGDSINNSALRGEVFILEISPLSNREYQADFDRTIVIHEIYKNYGLKIFTIPLDASEITVEAFFEERSRIWPVAKIGSFDVQDVIEKFNISQVPTRLLIDSNGELIRKYEGREFQDVIQGLNQAFRTNNPS